MLLTGRVPVAAAFRDLAGKVRRSTGRHRAVDHAGSLPEHRARCVTVLRRTLPARTRNAPRWACGRCCAWARAAVVCSSVLRRQVARILGEHASCQRSCGMWGVGGARAVETACECHPDAVACCAGVRQGAVRASRGKPSMLLARKCSVCNQEKTRQEYDGREWVNDRKKRK